MSRLYSVVRKLRRIAASDLTRADKFRYVLKATRLDSGLITYKLRGGVPVTLRAGTTDAKVFDEIFVEGAYATSVAALPDNLGPVTLIDLGANIGLSALFLARALEATEIVAVEPDPANFRLLRENLRKSGLANRSRAVHAFAGAEHTFAELRDSGNGAWGMRMGALSDTGIPVLPLAEIAGFATCSARNSPTVVLKCDIEGGERDLFVHIRDWEHLIRYIFLELHTEFLPVEELLACLRSARFPWTIHGNPLEGDSIVMLLLERLP